jgi:cytidylate kinase
VWRDLINQAAVKAGVPEMALATIDELGLLGVSPSRKASRAYRQAVQQVMLELAAEGNVVIVGRAGQVVLAGRPEVLHVRIIAPPKVRAERIALRQGISLASAIAQVEASDHNRSSYMRRFYRVRWDNPELYDLIINTGRISIHIAADLICMALSQLKKESKNPATKSGTKN